MQSGHEIELNAPVLVHEAVEFRCGIVRFEDAAVELVRKAAELLEIGRCLSEHEIEIKRSDRRPLERSSRVADKDSLETALLHSAGNFSKKRGSVHDAILKLIEVSQIRVTTAMQNALAGGEMQPIVLRRNTSCISCRSYRGRDRFAPAFYLAGPVCPPPSPRT